MIRTARSVARPAYGGAMHHPADPRSNERVRLTEMLLLSDNWYRLHRAEFDYRDRTGRWSAQRREVYDRGNGATILLLDEALQLVLLIRQFRVPTYLNGNGDGMLLETPGGLLDHDEPAETTVRREVEEETGHRALIVHEAHRLYMSPGAVTEWVACFVGTYDSTAPVAAGGGLDEEGEDIEVVELPLATAWAMVDDGRINDAKTVVLLQWLRVNGGRVTGTSAANGPAPLRDAPR